MAALALMVGGAGLVYWATSLLPAVHGGLLDYLQVLNDHTFLGIAVGVGGIAAWASGAYSLFKRNRWIGGRWTPWVEFGVLIATGGVVVWKFFSILAEWITFVLVLGIIVAIVMSTRPHSE